MSSWCCSKDRLSGFLRGPWLQISRPHACIQTPCLHAYNAHLVDVHVCTYKYTRSIRRVHSTLQLWTELSYPSDKAVLGPALNTEGNCCAKRAQQAPKTPSQVRSAKGCPEMYPNIAHVTTFGKFRNIQYYAVCNAHGWPEMNPNITHVTKMA